MKWSRFWLHHSYQKTRKNSIILNEMVTFLVTSVLPKDVLKSHQFKGNSKVFGYNIPTEDKNLISDTLSKRNTFCAQKKKKMPR